MPSTGPNSRRGKAVSRRNAWKHGIRSYAIVVSKAEDAADWEEHVAGIFESLKPEGHLESMFAERIAINLWKMRRIDHFQNIATISNMRGANADLQVAEAYRLGTLGKGGKYPEIPEGEVLLAEALRVLPTTDDLEKIMRYEGHLFRQCIQALRELEAMQDRRRGGAAP